MDENVLPFILVEYFGTFLISGLGALFTGVLLCSAKVPQHPHAVL